MTMKPALHSFAYALNYLREQVADVAPADLAAQPAGIRNHPAWVMGHLARTVSWTNRSPTRRTGTCSRPSATPSRR